MQRVSYVSYSFVLPGQFDTVGRGLTEGEGLDADLPDDEEEAEAVAACRERQDQELEVLEVMRPEWEFTPMESGFAVRADTTTVPGGSCLWTDQFKPAHGSAYSYWRGFCSTVAPVNSRTRQTVSL